MHSPALIGKPNCLKVLCRAGGDLITPLTSKYLLQIVITIWKGLAGSEARGGGGGSRVQHTLKGSKLFVEAAVPRHPLLNYPSHPPLPERFPELSVCTLMLQGLNHPILRGAGAGA